MDEGRINGDDEADKFAKDDFGSQQARPSNEENEGRLRSANNNHIWTAGGHKWNEGPFQGHGSRLASKHAIWPRQIGHLMRDANVDQFHIFTFHFAEPHKW